LQFEAKFELSCEFLESNLKSNHIISTQILIAQTKSLYVIQSQFKSNHDLDLSMTGLCGFCCDYEQVNVGQLKVFLSPANLQVSSLPRLVRKQLPWKLDKGDHVSYVWLLFILLLSVAFFYGMMSFCFG